MGFQISPGINVTEIDLTTIVPSVATTIGGIAGFFEWGPANQVTLVDSPRTFRDTFGDSKSWNFKQWFSAVNFLGYGRSLLVVRSVASGARNAVVNKGGIAPKKIDNPLAITELDKGVFARFPGERGNSLKVAVFGGPYTTDFQSWKSAAKLPNTVFGDVPESSGNLEALQGTSTNDQIHIAVVDEDGLFTGQKDTVLERFSNLSIFPDGRVDDGSSNYYKTIVNRDSRYIIVGGSETPSIANVLADITGNFGDNINIKNIDGRRVVWNFGDGIEETPAVEGVTGQTASAVLAVTGDGDEPTFVNFEGGDSVTVGGVVFNFKDVGGGYSEDVTGDVEIGADLTASFNNFIERFNTTTWSPGPSGIGLVQAIGGIEFTADVGFTGGATFLVLEAALQGASANSIELASSGPAFFWTANDGVFSGPSITSFTGGVTAVTEVEFDPGLSAFTPYSASLAGGTGQQGTKDDLIQIVPSDTPSGYNLFEDTESVNVSLLIGADLGEGAASETVGDGNNTFVQRFKNLAEYRKDCVAFLSAPITDDSQTEQQKRNICINFKNAIGSSSYVVIDSGYKYQYDAFNDRFRWVPLNADMAGLVARTDLTFDPWFSPAGLNRGQVRNSIKLSFNPNQTFRDEIYPKGINPVISVPGEGTILFGDRTALSKPSAFDRINVRRLFIVLQKAIAAAAKYSLFEFNDSFTRQQFRSLVEPFLRDVKARRGIFDWKLVCDETNNSPEVIDRNEFVADIYIKPTRVINFIQLNFIATRTGVSFEEVGA